VTGVEQRNGKWLVVSKHPRTGNPREFGGFDAVVMTGAGPATEGFVRQNDPRITDGVAFWRDPVGFLARAGGREEPVVIAGSGGTSAAIAAYIARYHTRRPVIIIGNQAALFTRTESFFENALFSDEDAWAALEPSVRVNVSERLNRGVVWSSVSDVLSASRNVRFRPGRVNRVAIQPAIDEAPEELRVEVTDATGQRSDAASLVIDAAGFDAWWFLSLLPAAMRRPAQASGGVSAQDRRRALAAAMTEDLSLPIGHDGLHAPMLSLAQGPGYASLMVLGAMSERILRPYL
jgi:mycobactin lysine-N-oxygenase